MHAHRVVVVLILACSVAPVLMDAAPGAPSGDRGAGPGRQVWRPPPATFNDFGLVSPFAQLLTQPNARGGASAAASSGSAEEAPSIEWSQTEDKVVVTIWVPQLETSTVRVMLSITTLTFNAASKTGQLYKLELEELGGDILPGKSSWEATTDAAVVTLPKRSQGLTWPSLRGGGDGASTAAQTTKGSPNAALPRRRVQVNTTHKYDVLKAEASDGELGAGWLIARNEKVGRIITGLFKECS